MRSCNYRAAATAAITSIETTRVHVSGWQRSVRRTLFASLLHACASLQPLAVDAADQQQSTHSWHGLIPGRLPGTLQFAGSKTSFGFGGYFETHLGVSDSPFEISQTGSDSLFYPQIPLGENAGASGDKVNLHARHSRLWFKTYTPTDWGELNLFLEYDLSERPGSYAPRQRHAYVSLGQVLIGQTYTTFTNSASQPDTDSGLPPAGSAKRHAQLRWTLPLTDPDMNLMLAVEQPESRINQVPQAGIQTYDDDHDPNFAVRLNRYGGWGEISLSAMTRSLRWFDNGQQSRTRANAFGLSGRIFTSGLNNVRFVVNGGFGLGSFITSGSYPDAVYQAVERTLESSRIVSAEISYQHYWNSRWRSNLVFSESRVRLPEQADSLLTNRARALQANLLFNPQSDLTLGVEYLYADRRVLAASDGALNRLMLTARYTFQTE